MKYIVEVWTFITSNVTTIVTVGVPLVTLLSIIVKWVQRKRDQEKLYKWVLNNTKDRQFRSSRTIAGKNNMKLDRVEELLSSDARVRRGLGTDNDIWALNDEKP